MFTTEQLLPAATASVKVWRDTYETDVRSWYENGPGAPCKWVTEYDVDGNPATYNVGGQGYAYPNCIHGSSLWTDYDNICFGCEDGATDEELAEHRAANAARQINERQTYLSYRPADMPGDLAQALIDWTFAPLKALQPRKD